MKWELYLSRALLPYSLKKSSTFWDVFTLTVLLPLVELSVSSTTQWFWGRIRVSLIAFPFTLDSISEASISSNVPWAFLLLNNAHESSVPQSNFYALILEGLARYDPNRGWAQAGVGVSKAGSHLIRSQGIERDHRVCMTTTSPWSKLSKIFCLDLLYWNIKATTDTFEFFICPHF